MRLEQLQYIVEIDKTRSISKAADNLYITQPSISAAVSALEKELKVKIFSRSKSGMEPTAEGEKIIALAREILGKTQEIYAVSSEQHLANLELLTIPAINSGILGQVFSKWQKKHEQVSLQVRECKVTSVLNDFMDCRQENKRFFAICYIGDEIYKVLKMHFQAAHVKCEYLAADQMVCLMSANNPLAQQESITGNDFRAQPKIRYEYANSKIGNSIFANSGYLEGFEELYSGNIKMNVSTLESLKQLIAEDVGVTAMPSIIVNNDMYFRDGQIKIKPFNDADFKMKYYLLYNESIALNETEKDFVQTLKQAFKNWEKNDNCFK